MNKLAIALAIGMVAIPIAASAQSTTCSQTLTADAQAIAADLAAIASQAQSQGFQTAVQKLASDLRAIIPALSMPDQALVQKFLTDLANATSASGPGGSTITSAERIQLTNGITQILLSTGMTTAQINTILTDIGNIGASLQGISTAQLKADLQKTMTDIQACRPRQ